MSLAQEFKTFIMRGNVVDLAVGVIIGAAFGKIVTSLVDHIIMPPLGLLIGGIDFSHMKWVLKAADPTVAGSTAVALEYGLFINTLIQFLIISFAIFWVVKVMNMAMKKDEAPAEPPAPSATEVLLAEIRDALKAKP
ncbi:MAG: large-conductance mechanosensitive channel protein MscL [Asticcacaulis sp.]